MDSEGESRSTSYTSVDESNPSGPESVTRAGDYGETSEWPEDLQRAFRSIVGGGA